MEAKRVGMRGEGKDENGATLSRDVIILFV